MKEALVRYLVCPDCREALRLTVFSSDHQEIEEGELLCSSCSTVFPIVKGIPRFVPSDAYVKNFSFQWNTHRTTQVDSLAGHSESLTTFQTKTGLSGSELTGKLVLDVGVGTGRFMEVANQLGAEVIGIDLSFAVDAAYTNMGRRAGVHLVQADVFRLPFRSETFDVIYSIGVLHHTPDTNKAFAGLPPLLKHAGIVAIWVYVDAGEYSKRLDRVRAIASRIPRFPLYGVCWVAVPLLHVMARIPGFRGLAMHIPVSNQGRGITWDVLDTFDAYSPRYQWKHSEPEVIGWFKDANLEEIKVLSFPVSLRGRKP
ncbi:MAG: methyltransferase domain-containing protein [Nitrospira sp.]|nr:methyltransferase domain-containing protein [Nitrospira sp.]